MSVIDAQHDRQDRCIMHDSHHAGFRTIEQCLRLISKQSSMVLPSFENGVKNEQQRDSRGVTAL